MSQTKSVKTESWFVTITDFGNGCPDNFIKLSLEYLKTFDECLATVEKQQNGNDHVHAMFKAKGQNTQIKLKLKKGCYNITARTKIPPNAIKLEKVKSTPMCVQYIIKELEEGENPSVCVGFTQTWIQEQAAIAFKKTRSFQKYTYVKVDQVPPMLYEYCNIKDIRISTKGDFIQLLIRISEEGYNTRLWSKHISWIYAQFMLLKGDNSQSEKYWENCLRFD